MPFTNPSRDKLDDLIKLSQSIERGKDISFSANQQVANLLSVPLAHYTTSVDAVLGLRDIIYAGYDYVNLDMREYDDVRGLVFMMKIETQYGETEGEHHTRPGAILDALLNQVIYEIESGED